MNKALKNKWLNWFASKDCAKFVDNPPGSIRYNYSQSFEKVFLRPWIDQEEGVLKLSNESQKDIVIDLDMIENMTPVIQSGQGYFQFPCQDGVLSLTFFSLESAPIPSWAAEDFDAQSDLPQNLR